MANDIQRRLRRAKDSERRFGKWLLKHDGLPTRFIINGGVATSTGRVGHITGLQFDNVSMSYAGENKQVKVWAGLWTFWKQIVQVARREGLEPVLRIEPTNEDRAGYPNMHIISEERHAELLGYERQVKAADVVADITPVKPRGSEVVRPVLGYSKEQQTGRSTKRAVPRRVKQG